MKKFIRVFGKWLALAVWILAAGFCCSCRQQEDELLAAESVTVEPESVLEKAETASAESEEEPDTFLYVYVCGAVVDPGVYRLHPGQRIYEAIDLAGGFTEEAAESYLNLAEPVTDGMKVEVPGKEQAEEWQESGLVTGSSPGQGNGKVNLNTAAKELLMTLNGIGEARAADIIRYRQEHGKFEKIEDIMQVPGIKETAFQKIKDEITVSP